MQQGRRPPASLDLSRSTASSRRSPSSALSSIRATQRTLARGERMVATLNQPQYEPVADRRSRSSRSTPAINGYLDEIPVGAGASASRTSCASTCARRSRSSAEIRETGRALRTSCERLQRRARRSSNGSSSVQEDAGRGVVRWRRSSDLQAADPLDPQHAQDHEGDGARRLGAGLRGRRRGSRRCGRTPTG